MGYTATGGPKGRGQFNNSPSTTSDLNKLLEIEAEWGNYGGAMSEGDRDDIVGSALYAGLMIMNTTSGALEVYDGDGWVIPGDSGWRSISTLSSGWSSVSGYSPQYRVVGNRVDIRGRVLLGAGGIGSILTVPMPPARATDLGTTVNLTGAFVGTLHISTGGLVSIPTATGAASYFGSASSGLIVKLNGSWYLD